MDGILVMGSTGEFPAMTESMRQDVIDATMDAVSGKITSIDWMWRARYSKGN